MNKDNPPAAPLQPLAKLMKIPRGKKYVDIDPALLPKLDLATIENTLRFTLRQTPLVHVAIERVEHELQCNLCISTAHDDWPYGTSWQTLYALVIANAADRISVRKPASGHGPHCAYVKHCEATIQYRIALQKVVHDLFQLLETEFIRVLKEVPAVLDLLSAGPQPGKYNDEDEEETGNDNDVGDGEG